MKYSENIYSRNWEIKKNIDKFLQSYDLPKFTQKVSNHLNIFTMGNKITAEKNSLQQKT
jgi:hypothetical protein